MSKMEGAEVTESSAMTPERIAEIEKVNLELKAELAIVRGNLEKIASQPWAPNGYTILAALMVTKVEVKVWLASHPAGEPC